jgi:hypothetical protein
VAQIDEFSGGGGSQKRETNKGFFADELFVALLNSNQYYFVRLFIVFSTFAELIT